MRGVIVSGTLALVDGPVVRFLRGLAARHGPVWVVPRAAALAPVVDLDSLRYILGQLRCVAGVAAATAELPANIPVVPFPVETAELAQSVLRAPVADNEEQPGNWTLERTLSCRPRPLVMVSGCFDLVHAGHVHLIHQAAKYGPGPVVAALTSAAIRTQPKNRDRPRPLWGMADRLTVLEELRSRPRVLFFDGPDCRDLIRRLQPDVWVKEQRDRGRPVVEEEARLVEYHGGRVVWEAAGAFTASSTEIENLIRSRGLPG